MKKEFENWEPTHEQNIGIVSSVYEFIKEELSELQEIIRLTWRNPVFMAFAIALIWLIPQLLIRRILSENYKKKKLEKQKDKIRKLYPKALK